MKMLPGLPCGSAGKESARNVGGSLGWEDPIEKSYPFQYSGLENSMDSINPWGCKGYPLHYSGLENSMDYSPWGHKELYMTKRLSLSLQCYRKSVGSPAAHRLRGNKQARLVERKVCFISDACNCGGRVVDIYPKAASPYPCNQWDKSFYRHKWGWGTTCRNSTVISDSHLQVGHRWSD